MKRTVITLGRQYGSGGRLIALNIAKELGIPFYDKEILTQVAKATGFSEDFLNDSEKKPTGSLLFDRYAAVPTPTLSEQVFIAQSKVIRELAMGESCIIVGRCADYILRDFSQCLKVFVHAPIEERVKRASEEYGVVERSLEHFVLKQDKARASYYNYFASSRWGEASTYDLCINSAMGIETTSQVIIAAMK